MITFYAMQIKLGKMTINDVPILWRNDVKRLLEEMK